jgi:transcriptional regulator with XRE-family HTH domain
VIDMGFLSVIRRWALRDKMPIREIARRTGLSRNTIKKYLRAGIVEPRFQTPARPSKLTPYAEKLTCWLVTEQRKPRKDRRRQRLLGDLLAQRQEGDFISLEEGECRTQEMIARKKADRDIGQP